MIQLFIDWLVNVITVLGYPGVFLAVFIESFFAPIPSEIILPFSGFVASGGDMNIYIVILLATLASYLGSLPFYIVGLWGEKYFMNFINRYGKYLFIEDSDVEWTFQLFEKFGTSLVLFGRLVPIVRTLISFPAGVAKIPFLKFSVFTLLGSLIWNILLTYTGYILGDHWESVGGYISKYENVILFLILLVLIWYFSRGILKRLSKRRRK